VLGSLTLRVVEVGRDSNDGVLDLLVEVGLGSLLHLVEDKATNLRWRVLLAASLNPSIAVGVGNNLEGNLLDVRLDLSVRVLATDETLGGKEGVFGVDDGLTLSSNTNQALAVLSESNNRWCCSCTCIIALVPSLLHPTLCQG